MADESKNFGPLESQVSAIFKSAWEGSSLKPPSSQPNTFQITSGFVEMMGEVEKAIRLVAAAVDHHAL